MYDKRVLNFLSEMFEKLHFFFFQAETENQEYAYIWYERGRSFPSG